MRIAIPGKGGTGKTTGAGLGRLICAAKLVCRVMHVLSIKRKPPSVEQASIFQDRDSVLP